MENEHSKPPVAVDEQTATAHTKITEDQAVFLAKAPVELVHLPDGSIADKASVERERAAGHDMSNQNPHA